jgi:hypothetical protein
LGQRFSRKHAAPVTGGGAQPAEQP